MSHTIWPWANSYLSSDWPWLCKVSASNSLAKGQDYRSWGRLPFVVKTGLKHQCCNTRLGASFGESGLNTIILENHYKMLMLNDSIGRCELIGYHRTIGLT